MSIKNEIQREAGHPWDGRPGFDVLFVDADTTAEIDAFVAAAKKKFWHCWLIGTVDATGNHGGVMYKPTGASSPWEDSPERPHPGFNKTIEAIPERVRERVRPRMRS